LTAVIEKINSDICDCEKIAFRSKNNLKMNQNLSLYLTTNALCLRYKDQAVDPFNLLALELFFF